MLGHADGICHIYVDAAADMDKARRICVDAKVDYPAACNAGEHAGAKAAGRRWLGGGPRSWLGGCRLTAQLEPQVYTSPLTQPQGVPSDLPPPAVEKILVHESLTGEKLDSLVKALQDAGACVPQPVQQAGSGQRAG